MNANSQTLEEIEDDIKNTGYKFLSLVKPNGAQIIAFNSGKIDAKMRMNEIRRRLKSKSLPDGLYIILAKSSLQARNVPDEFPYQKGKAQPLAEDQPIKAAKNNPEVTSFSEVLKLKNRITELEFEVKDKQRRIDELEEELDELEEQLENQPATTLKEPTDDFLSRAGDWLQKTMITVQPLIDKHFELKEMQIKNDTARLMIQSKQQPKFEAPQHKAPPVQDTAVQYTISRITGFIEQQAAAGDVDKYEDLAKIYNGAQDLDDFYNKVKQYDAQTFAQLIEFINAKN